MQNENWQTFIRAFFENTWAGYIWFMVLAVWGGTATYISRLRKNKLAFSLAELLGEWAISGFAGFITALFCVNLGYGIEFTAAAAGIAGHMGGRAIGVLESAFIKKFNL